MIRKILLGLSFITATSTYAATIDPLSIPDTFTCTTPDGTTFCAVDYGTQISTPGLDAVQLIRQTATGYVFDWLIRYDLYSPSSATYDVFDESIGEDGGEIIHVTNSYTGSLWLEAPEQLNPDGISNFTLHQSFDRYSDSEPSSLGMTYSDASNGTAYNYMPTSNTRYYSEVPSGDLVAEFAWDTCVECGWDVNFNLIGFEYINGELAFKPDVDANSLLFSYTSTNPEAYMTNGIVTSQLHVVPAPLPAAAWLFGSGLLGLIGVMRRHRKQA